MRHGTRSMYLNGPCRCEPCSVANRRYAADYYREGKRRSTPSWPVYQHLAALRAAGVSMREVADLSGYPYGTVLDLAGGKRKSCRVTTAEDLLSIPLPEVAA